MTDIRPPLLGTMETALYADDLTAATAFWQDVMGLTAFQTVPGRHVFFRIGDTPHPQVLLVFRAEATERPAPPDARLPVPSHGARGPGHFCMAVGRDHIDDWCRHLQSHDVGIEADFHWPNGARSIYFRDPAGNSIELAEPSLWA
ncbi:VOC family protein [Paracoccus sp. Z330]|uniref:VOC family protein n=1 Tax=Paracoccus onchidii TaxID=3017813 RepID=A0ABT4ZBG6_9RHOB|nr:VOC family protein [Paracoccus onchidii]MDB6176600.1 VOC family protein [Paracoccus onchidii]